MNIIDLKTDKILSISCFLFLIFMSLGLVGHVSFLNIAKYLVCIPIACFLFKQDFKKLPKSVWALFLYGVVVILSVVFNQDITEGGYSTVTKSRYFFLTILGFSPCLWYFKNKINEKQIKYLLYVLCTMSIVANICGIISMNTDISLATLERVHSVGRNQGLMKYVFHYAHNLAFFLIIILYLLVNKKSSQKFINYKFLIFVFVFNLLGLYLTYTRAAWLTFAIGAPFVIFFSDKKKFFVVISAIICLGLGAYYYSGKKTRRAGSDMTRIGLWQSAIIGSKERPLLGFGYANFENVTQEIKYKNNLPFPEFKGTAHSNYFEALGGTGYLGLAAFLGWCILWALEAFKRKDELTFAFIVAFLIGGIPEPTFFSMSSLMMILGMYVFSSSWHIIKSELDGKKQKIRP